MSPWKWLSLALMVAGGCTKTVNQCSQDSDCKDVAYPFCDVNGEYSASGGEHNVCTIVPADCPVERCGCEPGGTTCNGDQHVTCGTDGKSQVTETCALGCAASSDRCSTFKPSNGLDAAMAAAAGEPAAVWSRDTVIDTDMCVAHDATDLTLQVKAIPITQISAPGICAFAAGSFDVGNVVVTGDRALAFVAPGPIIVRGMIDEAARPTFHGTLPDGPGAVTIGACIGQADNIEGGGAGNATNGGDGIFLASVPVHRAGGLAQTNFSPLIGGCIGAGGGGGGGGALQIVSFTSIDLASTSLLALGGAGGGAGGGGAGGTVVLESPKVSIEGKIAANGGGGALGYANCPASGADATNDDVAAPGGAQTCDSMIWHGGNGGTAATPPANGTVDGSGGGSVGRILIRTSDGTFVGPGPLFSVVPTMDMLLKQ